jgi:hypothetical protein
MAQVVESSRYMYDGEMLVWNVELWNVLLRDFELMLGWYHSRQSDVMCEQGVRK